jgi:hypothetical protein
MPAPGDRRASLDDVGPFDGHIAWQVERLVGEGRWHILATGERHDGLVCNVGFLEERPDVTPMMVFAARLALARCFARHG